MSTTMYDLRIKGNNYCEWNQEFVINEEAAQIYQKNVIIMFELLDFDPGLIKAKDKRLRGDKLYPVAWGYLRPLGATQIHR